MRPLTAFAAIIAASPALAHPGAHLHPHGAGNWLPLIIGSSLVAAAALFALMKSR
jgi:hypothetical protein